MAYAGRILIMPKGDYDSTVSYERLDLVRHNGQCWLAKRNVSNVEPSADAPDDWFLMLEGIGEDPDGYLPITGGTIDGNLIAKSANAEYRTVAVVNSVRDISHQLAGNGNYAIYDSTNGKAILQALADGTNTFNGTASGNLPLSGGILTDTLRIFSSNDYPLIMKKEGTGSCYVAYVTTDENDGTIALGRLGFDEPNRPAFRNTSMVSHDLYHTGNITSGTTELTAGTSALPKGHFYAQYE